MTSKSIWTDTDVAPEAEVLDGVHECDVAVIGSGIAGISTAYEPCKRGKSVIVIDRGRICGGMTSHMSARLLCRARLSHRRNDQDQGQRADKAFSAKVRLLQSTVSRKSRRKKRSSATSGGLTAISSRAGTCLRI